MKSAASKPIPIGKAGSPGGRGGTPSKPGNRAAAANTSSSSSTFARSVPNMPRGAGGGASSQYRQTTGSSLAAPHFGSLKTPHSFLDEMPVLELEAGRSDAPLAAAASSYSAAARSLPGGGGGGAGSLVMSLSQMKILDSVDVVNEAVSLVNNNTATAITDDAGSTTILGAAQRGWKSKQELDAEEEASFAAMRSDEEDDDDAEFGVRFKD